MRFLLLCLAACVMLGCESDPFLEPATDETDWDAALTDVLTEASGGAGPSYFMLPEANDFSAIPQDPRNPITVEKVRLGKLLYHETGLAINPKRPESIGTYSCASCHHAAAGFQAGSRHGVSEGGWGFGTDGSARRAHPSYPVDELDIQPIRTPSALNVAYQPVTLWNGQFGATDMNASTAHLWPASDHPVATNRLGYEGAETQAIAGLAVHRLAVNSSTVVGIDQNTEYVRLFDAAFSDWPTNERISNETAGLAIAAYERTLLANRAPFQRWLRGEEWALKEQQKHGAVLFFGKAGCTDCHTGPALNSMTFHALGMGDLAGNGVHSPYNPDDLAHLGRGGFTGNPADNYKFKTPQLYNLADAPFYGHGGTFRSIRDVILYKNDARPEHAAFAAGKQQSAMQPLSLTEDEVDALTAFLEVGLRDPSLTRYVPSHLPTGNCFPVADAASRRDLGC
ncbi:MAG: cytochrome c peroxidase [Rhodothermales bacterium]